jgi:hypothetical protein
MSVLDSRKAFTNLRKKGFIESSTKSNDHKWLELYYQGKFILHTKLSHNNHDLGDYLIKQMSYQCHLQKDDFIDLVNCPLSKEEFFKILDRQGLLD